MAHVSKSRTSRNTDLGEIDFTKPWDFSDVVFVTDDGKKVYSNKTTLAQWSPVMKAMFFQDFKEKGEKAIKLPEKSHEEILELVKWAHPLNKDPGDRNVEIFLRLAREYQIEELTNRCERFLLSQPSSVSNLLLSKKFSLQSLEKDCMEGVQETRFCKLRAEPGFPQLGSKVKIKILQDKVERYEPILDDIQGIADGAAFRRECWDRQFAGGSHKEGSQSNCKTCQPIMAKALSRIRDSLKKF